MTITAAGRRIEKELEKKLAGLHAPEGKRTSGVASIKENLPEKYNKPQPKTQGVSESTYVARPFEPPMLVPKGSTYEEAEGGIDMTKRDFLGRKLPETRGATVYGWEESRNVFEKWDEVLVPWTPTPLVKADELHRAFKRLGANKYGEEARAAERDRRISTLALGVGAPFAGGVIAQHYNHPELMPVPTSDQLRKRDYAVIQEHFNQIEYEHRPKSMGAQWVSGVAHLLPYMVEFATTGAIADLIAKGKLTIGPTLRAAIKSRTVLGVASKGSQVALKAAARGGLQAAISVHKWAPDFAKRRLPQLQIGPDGEVVISAPTESVFRSFAVAFGDLWIEYLAEQAGPALLAGPQKALAAWAVSRGPGAQGALKLLKAMRGVSPRGYSKLVESGFKRAGWDGMVAELGEERLGDLLRVTFGIQDFGKGTRGEAFLHATWPGWEAMLVEMGVLAVPGAIRAGANSLLQGPPLSRSIVDTAEANKLAPVERLVDANLPDMLALEAEEVGENGPALELALNVRAKIAEASENPEAELAEIDEAIVNALVPDIPEADELRDKYRRWLREGMDPEEVVREMWRVRKAAQEEGERHAEEVKEPEKPKPEVAKPKPQPKPVKPQPPKPEAKPAERAVEKPAPAEKAPAKPAPAAKPAEQASGEPFDASKIRYPKPGAKPRSRVKYNRRSIENTISAALHLKSDKPQYVFATAGGFTIANEPPPGSQSHVVVLPSGRLEVKRPTIGGPAEEAGERAVEKPAAAPAEKAPAKPAPTAPKAPVPEKVGLNKKALLHELDKLRNRLPDGSELKEEMLRVYGFYATTGADDVATLRNLRESLGKFQPRLEAELAPIVAQSSEADPSLKEFAAKPAPTAPKAPVPSEKVAEDGWRLLSGNDVDLAKLKKESAVKYISFRNRGQGGATIIEPAIGRKWTKQEEASIRDGLAAQGVGVRRDTTKGVIPEGRGFRITGTRASQAQAKELPEKPEGVQRAKPEPTEAAAGTVPSTEVRPAEAVAGLRVGQIVRTAKGKVGVIEKFDDEKNEAFVGIPQWPGEATTARVQVQDLTPVDLSVEAAERQEKLTPLDTGDPGVQVWTEKGGKAKAVLAKMQKINARTKRAMPKPKKPSGKPPKMPAGKFKTPADKIKAIAQAAASPEVKGKYAYSIANVLVAGDKIVATDGHRLWIQVGKFGLKDGLYNPETLKIEKKAGSFPKYQDIIPKDAEQVAEFDALETWRNIRKAALMTDEESRGILVILNGDGTLGFGASAPEIGVAEIHTRDDGKVLFAARGSFLWDTIAWHARNGDKTLTLEYSGPHKPFIIKGENGKTMSVTMPVEWDIDLKWLKGRFVTPEAEPEARPPQKPAPAPEEEADILAEGKTLSGAPSEIKPEPTKPDEIAVDIYRKWPDAIQPVGGDYWTIVMEMARRLETKYRYKAMRSALGKFKAQAEAPEIKLADIHNVLTACHELGHDIDWLMSGRKFPRSIKLRFPNTRIGERALRAELANLSRILRPDLWAKGVSKYYHGYVRRHNELMADAMSMYMLAPEIVSGVAPNIGDAIEAKLQQFPEIKSAVDEMWDRRLEGPDEPPLATEVFAKLKVEQGRAQPHVPEITGKEGKDYIQIVKEMGLGRNRIYAAMVGRAQKVRARIEKLVPSKERQEDLRALVEGSKASVTTGRTADEIKASLTPADKKAIELARAEQEAMRQTVNRYLRGVGHAEYVKFLENYFIHAYETPLTQKYKGAIAKWAKRSPQQRRRVIPTLEEAAEMGFKGKTYALGDGIELWASINYRVMTNVALLKQLPHVVNADGEQVLQSPKEKPEWPTVDYWPIRKAYAIPLAPGKLLLWHGQVAVDPQIRPYVDALFGHRSYAAWLRALEGINAVWKGFQLTIGSFFHHWAELHSALGALGPWRTTVGLVGKEAEAFGARRRLFGLLPARIGILKAGKLLEQSAPIMEDMQLHGVQTGYIQTEGRQVLERMFRAIEAKYETITQRKGLLGGAAQVGYIESKVARKGYQMFQHLLWDNVQHLKSLTYYTLVQDGIKHSGLSVDAVKDVVGKYIANNYGGQEWFNTVFRKPKTRQFFTFLMMSLDWTWSQIKTGAMPFYSRPAIRAIEGLGNTTRRAVSLMPTIDVEPKAPSWEGSRAKEAKLYRKFMRRLGRRHWFNYLMAGAGILILGNYLSTGGGPWDNELGHEYDVDYTRAWRAMPWNWDWEKRGDKNRRYIAFGKAGRELWRWFTDPLRAFGYKLSPVVRTTLVQLTGSDVGGTWNERWNRDDLDEWEKQESRLGYLFKQFKPFSLSGNNAFLAFPARKGMTRWKAMRAYAEIYRGQAYVAAGGIRGKLAKLERLMDRDSDKLMEQIKDACQRNEVDWEKAQKAAMSKVRSMTMHHFWSAAKKRDVPEMERWAKAYKAVGGTAKGFAQSARMRADSLPEGASEVGTGGARPVLGAPPPKKKKSSGTNR